MIGSPITILSGLPFAAGEPLRPHPWYHQGHHAGTSLAETLVQKVLLSPSFFYSCKRALNVISSASAATLQIFAEFCIVQLGRQSQ